LGILPPSANQPTTSGAVNGKGVEIGGFPMPDTEQMLPFKPVPPHVVTSHPVSGGNFYWLWFEFNLILGAFPPPVSAGLLMQQLPPPWTFTGPFVDLTSLMESLANFTKERKQIVKVESKECSEISSRKRFCQ
jgi:hypothetical protein